jgi:hypothetical protein
MRDLERDPAQQSLEAMSGAHDDRIMAMAMVLFSMHALSQDWTERGGEYSSQGGNEEPSFALYDPNEYRTALEEISDVDPTRF